MEAFDYNNNYKLYPSASSYAWSNAHASPLPPNSLSSSAGSQPLSWSGSSQGSTYTDSAPSSPMYTPAFEAPSSPMYTPGFEAPRRLSNNMPLPVNMPLSGFHSKQLLQPNSPTELFPVSLRSHGFADKPASSQSPSSSPSPLPQSQQQQQQAMYTSPIGYTYPRLDPIYINNVAMQPSISDRASFMQPSVSPRPSFAQNSTSPRPIPEEEHIDNPREDSNLICLANDCGARFKRRADLDRHYKNVHGSDNHKDSFRCDYPRCQRRDQPFNRRDHFRDHLRDFHKEDIEKRGNSWARTGSAAASAAAALGPGIDTRRVNPSWWRCSKCLMRVVVARNDFSCPRCKQACEPSRVARRRRHPRPAAAQ